MQVVILSTALLLAGTNMADAYKQPKYEVDCKEYQTKAAHYWKEASEKHDYKCDKIEHIYKKALSYAPKNECETKYGSYLEYHYNEFDKKCDKYEYDNDNEEYDDYEEEKDCKYYQKEAAKYWEDTAEEYGHKCEKIEHIYKKALSYAPKDECKTKYGSYIQWHYNELDKECDEYDYEPEIDCKKYQKEAAQYWNKSAKHHHYKCEKLEHIYKKALSYAPKNECKTKYESYVEWHYNQLDNKCDY